MTSGSSATLNDVYFVDELHGWAVGLENTILATTDGCTTWSPQTPGTPANTGFHAVFFTSATDGWVAGLSNVLLKTVNGGATWTSVNTGVSNVDLEDIWFATPEIGNVVGGQGLTGTIVRTTNGGASWSATTVQGGMNAVQFVSPTKGWVCGNRGAVYHTSDGINWVEQLPFGSDFTYTLKGIHMLNENEGWVVGGRVGYDNATFPGMLHTVDGGQNWDFVATGTVAGKTDVHFFNGQEGWRSHTSPLGEGYPLRSTSAGGGVGNWVENTDSLPTIHALHFHSPTLAWGVGSYGVIVRMGDVETGIRPAAAAPAVHVAPNPARDQLRIEAGTTVLGAEVLNLDGRNCGPMQRTADNVDVSALAPGMYLLRVFMQGHASPTVLRFAKE